MGPICDRRQEHLGPADKGIIQMRRLLREGIDTGRGRGRRRGGAELLRSLLRTPGIAARRQLAPNPRSRHHAGEDITNGVRAEATATWPILVPPAEFRALHILATATSRGGPIDIDVLGIRTLC